MSSKSPSESFPGFDRFYVLEEGGDGAAFRADFDPPVDVDRLMRGEIAESEVLALRYCSGRLKAGDVVFTSEAAPILIHSRVRQRLVAGGFTGWHTYEARLFDRANASVPGYFALACKGRAGPVLRSMSVPIARLFPAGPSDVLVGMYFEPSTWDGSDVFVLQNNLSVIVRDVVMESFVAAKVRNVQFTRLDEIQNLVLPDVEE